MLFLCIGGWREGAGRERKPHTDCQQGKLWAADSGWYRPSPELALSLYIMGTTWVPEKAIGGN